MNRPKDLEGVPAVGVETLLDKLGLATGPMLRRHRRRPAEGQQPVYCYWTGHAWAAIWQADEAVALPPLPPGRQRLYDQARTCAACNMTQLDPFQKGPDGILRYCEPCQEPAWEAAWHADRARERVESAGWAREVLADPTVLLVVDTATSPATSVHLSTLDGEVLLDAMVHAYEGDDAFRAGHTEEQRARFTPSAEVAATVAEVLPGRRMLAWRGVALYGMDRIMRRAGVDPLHALPVLAIDDRDEVGDRYRRWVGEPSPHGSQTYRYGRELAYQDAPWRLGAAGVAGFMRGVLALMAGEVPGG